MKLLDLLSVRRLLPPLPPLLPQSASTTLTLIWTSLTTTTPDTHPISSFCHIHTPFPLSFLSPASHLYIHSCLSVLHTQSSLVLFPLQADSPLPIFQSPHLPLSVSRWPNSSRVAASGNSDAPRTERTGVFSLSARWPWRRYWRDRVLLRGRGMLRVFFLFFIFLFL